MASHTSDAVPISVQVAEYAALKADYERQYAAWKASGYRADMRPDVERIEDVLSKRWTNLKHSVTMLRDPAVTMRSVTAPLMRTVPRRPEPPGNGWYMP